MDSQAMFRNLYETVINNKGLGICEIVGGVTGEDEVREGNNVNTVFIYKILKKSKSKKQKKKDE